MGPGKLSFLFLIFVLLGGTCPSYAHYACEQVFHTQVDTSLVLDAKDFLKPISVPKKGRIGLYFGTFDPVHEGHMRVAKAAIEKLNLDMLLMIPNVSPSHKPNATGIGPRLQMLSLRVAQENKINLILSQHNLLATWGRDQLIQTLSSFFSGSEVFQVMGQDSFEDAVNSGKLTPDIPWKILAFPRESETFTVDPSFLNVVTVATGVPPDGLSSTKLRSAIAHNESVDGSELNPLVYQYAQDHGLYH